MEKVIKNVVLETVNALKLLDRMKQKGATYEEMTAVLSYIKMSAENDAQYLSLYDKANELGIRDIYTKYFIDESIEYKTKQIKEAFKRAQNKSISVIRKTEVEINLVDICVGDQIKVNLKGIGEFTATAHQVTDKEVLFIMDEYIAAKPINGLQKWLDTVVCVAFPDGLKKRLTNITIPTIGQMFGWEDERIKKVFEHDSDEQLPLMKERRYRTVYLEDEAGRGWLSNRTKPDGFPCDFAYISENDHVFCTDPVYSYGVRPEFTLIKSEV